MQNHHLSKLIITTTTASDSEGFALRRLLKENWQQLLPDLSESFDQVCKEDEVIHLPKITISLAVDSMDSLVSDMPITHNEYLKDQIITQLMQQVQHYKTQLNNRESSSYQQDEWLDDKTNNEYLAEYKNTTKTNKQRVGLLTWQAVQSYLNSGTLPWFIMQEKSTKDLVQEDNSQPLYLSMQSLIKQNVTQCIEGLFEEHSAQKINRLIQLCDDELRKSIFESLVERALGKFNLLKNEEAGDARLKRQALVYICEEVIHKSANSIAVTNALFTQLMSDKPEKNVVHNSIIQGRILNDLIPETAKQFNISENVLSILTSRILRQTNVFQKAKNQRMTEDIQAENDKALDNISDQDIFKNATQVMFVGGILLYPYLTRLFNDLDYLSKDKTIKNNKHNSAVSVMVYLLTGQEQAFDYQLYFIKWLLGIPVNALITLEENSLTDNEKALTDNVLLSLKSHWSVMNNTSIDTIRKSFLQRSGMMKLDDEQCHLHIERKGIDVLIDQIPFSLSIIRLAWIKQPIIVTW
jgi:hypothetical protein